MFTTDLYKKRRKELKAQLKSGVILLPGNLEAAYNYPSNTYHFRQDSNFLYFFGLNIQNLVGVIDLDADKDYIFGNDVDIDDIIWMGPQPYIKDLASRAGIEHTDNLKALSVFFDNVVKQKRTVHIVPQYRAKTILQISDLLNITHRDINNYISQDLVKAIIKLRSIKDKFEVAEIEEAIDTAHLMHISAMRMAMPGVVEQTIAGMVEGIALSSGGPVSFPVILSVHGETLHNHHHNNILEVGRMMVTDAGCENEMNYCSDITRTVPVGGKFNTRQKEIYEIVLKANLDVIEQSKAGVTYRDMHFLAAKTIAVGLKDLGLMKGNIDEAVASGAHALFMPHGLGHMMGLDVHDMEGLGENNVGYDDEIKRSEQFGLAFLRLGRKLQKGFVVTDEPGIYFIPALIDMWRKEGKFTDFINYDKVDTYKDFGGIRIEDDLLITDTGCRVLGKPIPKTVAEIEETMSKPIA